MPALLLFDASPDEWLLGNHKDLVASLGQWHRLVVSYGFENVIFVPAVDTGKNKALIVASEKQCRICGSLVQACGRIG